MSDINDRENRKHPRRLEKAVVYRGQLAVAPQSLRTRVQRHECADVADSLRERGVRDSALLHFRLRATAQQAR